MGGCLCDSSFVEHDCEKEHRRHMTDGRWHDRCSFCLRRRRYGGTGIPEAASTGEGSQAPAEAGA